MIIQDRSLLSDRIQIQKDRHISQGMIQSATAYPDQEKLLISAFHRFFYRIDRIGIILFTGQYDRLHIQMRILRRIKIPDDQSRCPFQPCHMFQSAIAVDKKIIFPEFATDPFIIRNISCPRDHTSVHKSPFFFPKNEYIIFL